MNIPVREGETIEGSRTTRNRPYPVLKCSSSVAGHNRGLRTSLGRLTEARSTWQRQIAERTGYAGTSLVVGREAAQAPGGSTTASERSEYTKLHAGRRAPTLTASQDTVHMRFCRVNLESLCCRVSVMISGPRRKAQ